MELRFRRNGNWVRVFCGNEKKDFRLSKNYVREVRKILLAILLEGFDKITTEQNVEEALEKYLKDKDPLCVGIIVQAFAIFDYTSKKIDIDVINTEEVKNATIAIDGTANYVIKEYGKADGL